MGRVGPDHHGETLCEALKQDGILIRGVTKAEGAPGGLGWANYGFEFVQDGQTIGAVSLLGKGRVWLRQSLDEDTRLVVASVATALMVRQSLKS